jgi:aspartyl-tRNA(Asn)/glutamyl-tRNA(Gln) amidotransferase subunit A
MSRSPVADIARRVATRELSAVEATEAALAEIERLEPRLRAFVTVAGERALEEAAAADRRSAPRGPLHGVPLAVKDLEPTAGLRTTYGSRRFVDSVPEHDSVAIERLRAAGAIIVGKTNTPEFGLLGETRSEVVGETRNPWNLTRTTGGSSGGSAAAVAAGAVPGALGSDTAGSITCPAAMCGVFGLKPSRGLVPTWPDPGDARLFLDSGPLTASVSDARLLLEALAGPDDRDPTSFLPAPDREPPDRPLRIAWNPDWGRLAVDPEVRAACAAAAADLAELGHEIEEARPDYTGDPFTIAEPLLAADLWKMFERLGIDESDLSPDGREESRLLGRPSLMEYVGALNALTVFRRRFDALFEAFDLMVTPATAVPAFAVAEPPSQIDGREVEVRWTTFMPFAMPSNLAGLPTASVPCGMSSDGLPIGLQFTGPRGSDFLILHAAEALEAARPWPLPAPLS